MAHELGHYVLGHDSVIRRAASQAEYPRFQEWRELDANAKAVEILVRVQGLSEPEAVKMIADVLRRAADAELRGAPPTPGHLPPGTELADLLARFPESEVAVQERAPGR